MENLEKLKARIIEEARAKADKIGAEADEKAEQVLAEARANADAICREAVDKAQAAASTEEKRASIALAMDERNAVLRAKSEMVDEVLAALPQRISKLPDAEYCEFMRTLLVQAAPSGDVEVVIGMDDRKRLNSGFLQKAEDEIEAKGKQVNFRMSQEPADFDYGFILTTESVEVDCSLPSILRSYQDELAPLVAEALFGR